MLVFYLENISNARLSTGMLFRILCLSLHLYHLYVQVLQNVLTTTQFGKINLSSHAYQTVTSFALFVTAVKKYPQLSMELHTLVNWSFMNQHLSETNSYQQF